MAQRLTPRIVPPSPISVAVEKKGGPLVAYGLIADISGNGACVWTEGHLEVGSTLRFRISFADPPEIHDLVGAVVDVDPQGVIDLPFVGGHETEGDRDVPLADLASLELPAQGPVGLPVESHDHDA